MTPEVRSEAHIAWFDAGTVTLNILGPGPDGGAPSIDDRRVVQRGFLYHGGKALDGAILGDIWLFDAAAVGEAEAAPRSCPWTRIQADAGTTAVHRYGGAMIYEPDNRRFVLSGGFEPLVDGQVRTSADVFALDLDDLNLTSTGGAVAFAGAGAHAATSFSATYLSSPRCGDVAVLQIDCPLGHTRIDYAGSIDHCDEANDNLGLCFDGLTPTHTVNPWWIDHCLEEPTCGEDVTEGGNNIVGRARFGAALSVWAEARWVGGASGCEGTSSGDCAVHFGLLPPWLDSTLLPSPFSTAGDEGGRTFALVSELGEVGMSGAVDWAAIRPAAWEDASFGLGGVAVAPTQQYYDTSARSYVQASGQALLIGGSDYQRVAPVWKHNDTVDMTATFANYVHAGVTNPISRGFVTGNLYDLGTVDLWSSMPSVMPLATAGSLPGLWLPAATNAGEDRVLVWGGFDSTDTKRSDLWEVERDSLGSWTVTPFDSGRVAQGGNIAYDPWTDRAFLVGGDTTGVRIYERERRFIDEPLLNYVTQTDQELPDGSTPAHHIRQTFLRESDGSWLLQASFEVEVSCPDGNPDCTADSVLLHLNPVAELADLDPDDLVITIDVDGYKPADVPSGVLERTSDGPRHLVRKLVSPLPFAAGTRIHVSVEYPLEVASGSGSIERVLPSH